MNIEVHLDNLVKIIFGVMHIFRILSLNILMIIVFFDIGDCICPAGCHTRGSKI